MTTWVYIKSRSEELWTVGFYKPDGSWEPESDHPDPEAAARRTTYLNGGNPTPADLDPPEATGTQTTGRTRGGPARARPLAGKDGQP